MWPRLEDSNFTNNHYGDKKKKHCQNVRYEGEKCQVNEKTLKQRQSQNFGLFDS